MSKKRKHHKKKMQEEVIDDGMYVDYDENFSYIAGFTEGGAPYGTTWEETGIDPNLPLDERVRLLNAQEMMVKQPEEKPIQLNIHTIKGLFSLVEVNNFNDLDLNQKFCFTCSSDHENLAVCPAGSLNGKSFEYYEGEQNEWKMFEITEGCGYELSRLMPQIMSELNDLDYLFFTIPTPDALYVFTRPEDYKLVIQMLSEDFNGRQG